MLVVCRDHGQEFTLFGGIAEKDFGIGQGQLVVDIGRNLGRRNGRVIWQTISV